MGANFKLKKLLHIHVLIVSYLFVVHYFTELATFKDVPSIFFYKKRKKFGKLKNIFSKTSSPPAPTHPIPPSPPHHESRERMVQTHVAFSKQAVPFPPRAKHAVLD